METTDLDGDNTVQTYDLIMLAILIGAAIFGAIKGFAWQIASIASLAISYVVAYRYRDQVATYIDAEPPWNSILAMLLLYVGTSFATWIGFRVFSGMIDKVKLKEFDRHLGSHSRHAQGIDLMLTDNDVWHDTTWQPAAGCNMPIEVWLLHRTSPATS
jgi:uncharacterized membrane protein required for colicin V production